MTITNPCTIVHHLISYDLSPVSKFGKYQWINKETINLGTHQPNIDTEKILAAKEHILVWKQQRPLPTKEWVMKQLEDLKIREVTSHGGARNFIKNKSLAPPVEATKQIIGTMNQTERRKNIKCEYTNTAHVHLQFIAFKSTCVITGIKLDMENYPLSLDRIFDSLSHSWENCQLMETGLNMAKGQHEAFKSETAFLA